MTHVVGMRLTNFSRFRGTHLLDGLEPKAYAVVARAEEDEQRSNGFGKTTLAIALRYALHGVLPKSDYETLDHAISRGEETMAVDVEFSDGSYIERSRRRGKFATLMFSHCGHAEPPAEYHQEAAQEAIRKWLGMDVDAYDSCAHVAQKSADKFSTMRPDDLTALVGEWVGLSKVIDAEEIALAGLAQISKELKAVEADIARDEWVRDHTAAELNAVIEVEEKRLAELEVVSRRAMGEAQNYERWVQHSSNAETARQATARLNHLALNPVGDTDTEAAMERARQALDDASPVRARVRQLRVVAAGAFDGKCPVVDIQCPAKDEINRKRESAGKELATVEKDLQRREVEITAAQEGQRKVSFNVRRVAERKQEMAGCERLIRDGAESVAYIAKNGEPPSKEDEAAERTELPVIDRTDLRAAMQRLTDYESGVRALAGNLQAAVVLTARAQACRVAALALGPDHAQRVLCEGTVQSVENDANERLTRAGVDLRVAFLWGRETKKLASRCRSCGSAFPASARVKQCPTCSAVRGQEVEPKLHLKFSWRSGAAEDMGGVALTLSAGRWMRQALGSQWGTVWLDEPFASLDQSHRRALAGHICALVSDGVEQSFVTAHSREVLESLPGRIEITALGEWSEVRVVA